MRELNIGTKRFTKILVVDEPGYGHACHKYTIEVVMPNPHDQIMICGEIQFQNGPVKQYGVNGCTQEDLLAIVIDRLESFQSGNFACRENALALTKLQEALHWLNHRTTDRQNRNVEGTDQL